MDSLLQFPRGGAGRHMSVDSTDTWKDDLGSITPTDIELHQWKTWKKKFPESVQDCLSQSYPSEAADVTYFRIDGMPGSPYIPGTYEEARMLSLQVLHGLSIETAAPFGFQHHLCNYQFPKFTGYGNDHGNTCQSLDAEPTIESPLSEQSTLLTPAMSLESSNKSDKVTLLKAPKPPQSPSPPCRQSLPPLPLPSDPPLRSTTKPQRKRDLRLENLPTIIKQVPFHCPEVGCSGRFKRQEHLKRHMKCHSKEKPHTCWVPGCKRGFSRNDNLNVHYATTHGKRGGRNRYVATLDEQSLDYDPSFRGELTPDGMPVRVKRESV
ncbi:hypothetical protein AJ80_03270 [Polytolypa hystricis UAMH7299]|uniref:C2H2-type domain-containing protein n=1 Tax=Polytolypa hystricis (strain UAMH7299) TaxID=1447883 RepID=A0A2B7YK95_POLH7|nr:hypothetical protein AJ80_03270 [Polytolypa hystricis UAMH7299]